MVVPEHMVEPVGNLAQNLFINAPTLSQLSAASAAFDCDDELGLHLRSYTENRGILLKVAVVRSGAILGPGRCGVLEMRSPASRVVATSYN